MLQILPFLIAEEGRGGLPGTLADCTYLSLSALIREQRLSSDAEIGIRHDSQEITVPRRISVDISGFQRTFQVL